MTLSEAPDMLYTTKPNTSERLAAGDYTENINMSQSIQVVSNNFDRALPKTSSRPQFSSMMSLQHGLNTF